MAKVKPRIKVPKSASAGEIITIKTLISHKMESGLRKDRKTGDLVPRDIINKFVCSFDGEEIFWADWHPAISANPYLSFTYKVVKSGTLHFEWTDDQGNVHAKDKKLKVA